MDKQKIRDKLCQIMGIEPEYLPKAVRSDEWSEELIEHLKGLDDSFGIKGDFDPLQFIS